MLRNQVVQWAMTRLRLVAQRRGFYDCTTRRLETPPAQPRASYQRNLEGGHLQKPREEGGLRETYASSPPRSARFETSNSPKFQLEQVDRSYSQESRGTTTATAPPTFSRSRGADASQRMLFKKAPSELEMVRFTDDPLVLQIVDKLRAIELMLTDKSRTSFPAAELSDALIEVLHLSRRDHALSIQTVLTLGFCFSRLNRAIKDPTCVEPFLNACVKDDSNILPAVFYPLIHHMSSTRALISEFGRRLERGARAFFPPDSGEIRYLDQRIALIYMNLDDKEKLCAILEAHQALPNTSAGSTELYNLQLIQATSRMDRDQFEAVWNAMQAQQCAPDPTTLSVVLSMLIRCCELKKAEEVFYQMPQVYHFKRTKEHADYCAKAFAHGGRYESYNEFISTIKTDGIPWTPAVLEFAIRAATLNKHFKTLADLLFEAFTPQFAIHGDMASHRVFPTYPIVLFRHLDLTCFQFAVNEAVKAQKFQVISTVLEKIRAMYPEAAAHIFQQQDMMWNKRNWSSFEDETLTHRERS